MPMPTKKEYHDNEMRKYFHKIEELNASPLKDRQEAREEFYKAMKDSPLWVAEQIDWMLSGTYGYAEQYAAMNFFKGKLNIAAGLTQMVAELNWQSTADFARDAWKKLTADEKQALQEHVDAVIKRTREELVEEYFAGYTTALDEIERGAQ